MDLQQILSLTRKCIDKYHLIENNDKIAISLSGGKDSLTLSVALKELQRFYPIKFDIVAICVNLGFNNVNFDSLNDFFNNLNVPLYIVDTNINDIVFNIRKETNPCSLCTKLRKGALNTKAIELNCNKIALAHNKDDLIETMLMSLIYEGHFKTFKALNFLDKTKLTQIRPLIYIDESDIKGFANIKKLPILTSKCPNDGFSKREYTKNLIKLLEKENKGAIKSMFNACIKYIDNIYD